MHGARLVEAMHKLRSDLVFSGIGGKELAATGVHMLYDASKLAVVGLTEVISHLGDILAARKALIRQMHKVQPALLILIDYPDFNLLLAAKAKKLGIPVFYYISPQVWAWRSGRVKKIGRLTKRVGVILPFEKDFYAARGVNVDFVGHPLVDTVKVTQNKEEFFKAHNLIVPPGTKVIGILPGSRSKEIRSLLPDFLAAAHLLAKDKPQKFLFLLPRASTISKSLLAENGLDEYREKIKIHAFSSDRYNLMSACDAVVSASGTVTLELALLGIPTVTTYRVSPRTYRIGRLLISHIKYFSLVNLIANKKIITELLQDEVSPKNIADSLKTMIFDTACHTKIVQGLAEVTKKLGPSGCSSRAAVIALECIDSGGQT
jgi:lipid-A-disaccharide synthase